MKTREFLNHTVHEVIGAKLTEGNKFGIELELEGRGVGLQDVAVKGWMRQHDGSLRGESVEYTTSGSKELEDVKKSVTDLFKKLEANNVKFNNSIRTSTHVHLNFTDKMMKHVVNFFALFTVFEELLQYYSGEDRKGNLFCISSREAEGIVGVVATGIARGDFGRFAGDRFKYAACNLSTLYKFGTIEVRTMQGASSAEQVNSWLDILNDLYEYSLKMRSPADLITDLSQLGADALMRRVFRPASYTELMLHFPGACSLHYSLMEGARLIQIFAYEFDEDFKAEVKIDKAKKVKGRLPQIIEVGPNAGTDYIIYRPDGLAWHVRGVNGGRYWQDGEAVADFNNIKWNQGFQRFVCVYENGEQVPCNWRRHHEIADEGAPHPIRRLPRQIFIEIENAEDDDDVEVEHDDWDFDEGDEN